jgi:hypothetical protein
MGAFITHPLKCVNKIGWPHLLKVGPTIKEMKDEKGKSSGL